MHNDTRTKFSNWMVNSKNMSNENSSTFETKFKNLDDLYDHLTEWFASIRPIIYNLPDVQIPLAYRKYSGKTSSAKTEGSNSTSTDSQSHPGSKSSNGKPKNVKAQNAIQVCEDINEVNANDLDARLRSGYSHR